MQRVILSLILITQALVALAEYEDNIIISDSEDVYTIVASKSGDKIEKVKKKSTITFEATRTAGTALALEFYNNYITIDKTSGAKPNYRTWIPQDIFYDDSKVCYLELPIKKGGGMKTAVIEKTYTKPEFFTQVILPSSYFIKKKTIKITIPATLSNKINIIEKDFIQGIVSQKITEKNGSITYLYTLTNVPATSSDEPYTPHLGTIMPRLYIVGHFASLKELYKYLHSHTTHIDENIEKVNAFARNLTASCKSEEERISVLTTWVQENIRYIAIEHGEYATRPDYASEVLYKRYGDCKGMSSLLKAMFNAVGLDARLVWIGTEDVGSSFSEIHSLASGNHMICGLVREDSILFVDGTCSYLPIGCYHPSIQGREALIENGDDYILRTIPIQSPNSNSDLLHLDFVIDGNNLVGKQLRTLTGVRQMSLCHSYHSLNKSDREDFLIRTISYPKNNVEVSALSISGDSLEALSTVIHASVVENDACQHLENLIYVNLIPLRYNGVKTINLQNRKNDVLFNYLSNVESYIKLPIPDGYSIKHLPKSYQEDNEWFEAEIIYEEKEGIIKCHARFLLKKREVPLAEIKRWNTLIRGFNQANSEQLILTR